MTLTLLLVNLLYVLFSVCVRQKLTCFRVKSHETSKSDVVNVKIYLE